MTQTRDDIVRYSAPNIFKRDLKDPKAVPSCKQFFIMIMAKWQKKTFQKHPHVLIADCTFNTNKNGFSFIRIGGSIISHNPYMVCTKEQCKVKCEKCMASYCCHEYICTCFQYSYEASCRHLHDEQS